MKNIKNNLLEDYEAIGTVIGYVAGIGILSLPASLVKEAKQNGWIGVCIGGIYPLFMVFLCIYYNKKHPNEDILVLSKKYLGNVLGTICNIFFLINFIIYIIAVSSGFSNLLGIYGTEFLTPIKIIFIVTIMGGYLANKGIKVLGRANKLFLFLFIILSIILSFAFQKGRYLNLFPLFDTSIVGILNASKEVIFSYGGIEAIFLIYPFIKNKKKTPSVLIKGGVLVILIYTFITFTTIYYLGHKCVSKLLWPVIMVTESINLPFINSFRLLFLLLWSLIIIKLLANEYYAVIYIMKNLFSKQKVERYFIFMYPIFILLSLQLTKNEMTRRSFLNKVIPPITIFDFSYILIIAILIFIKNKEKVKGE